MVILSIYYNEPVSVKEILWPGLGYDIDVDYSPASVCVSVTLVGCMSQIRCSYYLCSLHSIQISSSDLAHFTATMFIMTSVYSMLIRYTCTPDSSGIIYFVAEL